MSQIRQTAAAPGPAPTAARPGFLQRQCDCGNHTFGGGACRECGKGAARAGNLRLGALDDPLEAEADRVSEQVMAGAARPAIDGLGGARAQAAPQGGVPASVDAVLGGSGAPLGPGLRQDMEGRFGRDFSGVRVHADGAAQRSARDIDARAYTAGQHVVFGAGQFAPASREGLRLIAHELTHVVQQSGAAPMVRRAPTKGQAMMDAARTWLADDATVKADVDVLKAALKEMAKGKSVTFNKDAGKKKIDALGAALSLSKAKIATLQADWEWLADHHKDAGKKTYQGKVKALLKELRSPLALQSEAHPKSQAKNWLKNTPDVVMDLMYQVADAALPVDQLYVYAAREGLIKYVRDQLKLGKTAEPTKTQLDTFDTKKHVDGFQYLGADDFMTELDAPRLPLRASLPAAVDLKKVTEHKNINEKNRTVRSADFPDLLMALHGFAALVRRRRKLFLEDAKAQGYAAPSTDELVYWTYVYFNSGEFGGLAALKQYKGKRTLSDWITKKKYPNAIVVLESYRMLKDMDSIKKMF